MPRSPFSAADFATCADLWKEHSGATRACTWLAILRFDYHSLTRQPTGMMVNLARRHLSVEGWHAARDEVMRQSRRGHMRLIIAILALVHGPNERCNLDMDPGNLVRHKLPVAELLARPPDNTIAAPGACAAPSFDIRKLPYRWLPGLPPPRAATRALLTLDEALRAPRLEVMHIADYWPGPVWLYHAPGSGVWWAPGKRVVARNLIDAILKFHSLDAVVAHINSVGNGDRRLNRYRSWLQWRVAFGGESGPSWAAVLAGAAQGNASFEHFASAGELLGQLLTADGAVPTGIDSLILTEQTHFWPRGSTWDVPDDGYAPSMVAPCAHERRPSGGDGAAAQLLHVRTHRVPEMVDLRAQRGNKRTRFGVPPRRACVHACVAAVRDIAATRACVCMRACVRARQARRGGRGATSRRRSMNSSPPTRRAACRARARDTAAASARAAAATRPRCASAPRCCATGTGAPTRSRR